ncbi:tyrosine-protein phosphatase [Catenulispora yoronensis]|uniref:Tyrosine-protein phosphatase n=2 Tax=Catenulispora yoronensis TaxID=450799 RepID=A0ABP5F5D8_9ACTN
MNQDDAVNQDDAANRHLEWDGCHNVRDLGGLPLGDSGTTRWGAVLRSDTPDRLTEKGWQAAREYGVRTIVDLRTPGEHRVGTGHRPSWLTVVSAPLHDPTDVRPPGYVTPLTYGPFLERRPERCAAVIAAIARAEPGGVLIHCVAGRDRTGIVSMLLLALAGVPAADVVADYELSGPRLKPLFEKLGEADEAPAIAETLARQGTTVRQTVTGLLDGLDVAEYLRSGGLEEADLKAARARLR